MRYVFAPQCNDNPRAVPTQSDSDAAYFHGLDGRFAVKLRSLAITLGSLEKPASNVSILFLGARGIRGFLAAIRLIVRSLETICSPAGRPIRIPGTGTPEPPQPVLDFRRRFV
jgi:hypothetical protein